MNELLADYRRPALHVRRTLGATVDCLARPAEKLDVRLANLAEANATLDAAVAASFPDAVRIWAQIVDICRSSGLETPSIEQTLTIEYLNEWHQYMRKQLEAKTRELDRLMAEEAARLAELNARQPIDKYGAILAENERISEEMRVCAGKMAHDAAELNPDLDSSMKARIQQDIERRARNGSQVLTDPSQSDESCPRIEQSIMTPLIPNLAVEAEVARIDPPTIAEVEETAKLTSETSFSVNTTDEHAALHVLGAIAQRRNLNFALTPAPSADVMKDAWNKSADFAMANDVLNESSMILLGSTCPQHQVKGISVHLRGDFDELEANPGRKRSCVTDVRLRLAQAHDVHPNEIIILGVTRGSVCVPYTVKSGIRNAERLTERFQRVFGTDYLRHDIHHSFSHLQINPKTFAPQWNRDFRIPSMCPQSERRGGYLYTPPAGWQRFGMDIGGKYEGGDEWIGMRNRPGEWALVYHGTEYKNVKSITQTPLAAGERDVHGHGIYCSPNPAVAARFTDWFQCPDGAKYSYMFVCRVNMRAVHHCTQDPCPEDRNSEYTVHITRWKDFWFVNGENQSYQNIRIYGILVKEGAPSQS
jgi:hypothetical protein